MAEPSVAQLWGGKADPALRCIVRKITAAGVYGTYWRKPGAESNRRAIPLDTFLLDYQLLKDWPSRRAPVSTTRPTSSSRHLCRPRARRSRRRTT